MANNSGRWALILGASSGFGAATSRALAQAGYNIFGVHLDRKSTMPVVEALQDDIRAVGGEVVFFNMNAADETKRREAVAAMRAHLGPNGVVRVVMHSLAFGALLPFVPKDGERGLDAAQVAMTLDVMASSLIYWAQDLKGAGLLGRGSKIYAMTSAGGTRVIPHYVAFSAAKAALESNIRQLAMELAPQGIAANSIRAGVTDTPALRRIPGNERMIEFAQSVNPSGRLTTPEDVAEHIVLFSQLDSHWLTGNVIGVDGGEDIVAGM